MADSDTCHAIRHGKKAGATARTQISVGGLLGMLSPLLDQSCDGSVMDDVLGKFLGGG